MTVEVKHLGDGGVLLLGTGVVTGDEILDAKARFFGSEAATGAVVYLLADFSASIRAEISEAQVRAIAERDRAAAAVNPTMVMAVVGRQDLVYGLGRMWETMLETAPIETRVFRDRAEAEQWIATKVEVGGP